MRVFIVEPHPDDYWINVGGWTLDVLKDEDELFVITVFTKGVGIASSVKTKMLSRFLRCKYYHKDLERVNLGEIINHLSKEEKNKARKEKEYKIERIYKELNGEEVDVLREEINNLIKEFEPDRVFYPLGLYDAAHNLLSNIEQKPNENTRYYREFPYFWMRSPFFKKANYRYKEYKKLETHIVRNKDLKWEVFSTVYNDQLGFFFRIRPYYRLIKDEVFYRWTGNYVNDYRVVGL